MKRVIKNKVYDTEKAIFIASANDETLYRKKTGEFFVHAENESHTLGIIVKKYNASIGIYPLTYEQARIWAEFKLTKEQINNIFDAPNSGEKTKLGARISAESAAKLQRVAVERGISQAELLDEWIKNGE